MRIIKNINTRKDVKLVTWIPTLLLPSIKFFISESDFIDCKINKLHPMLKKYMTLYIFKLKQDEKKDVCDDWATYNKIDLAKCL